jgi:hypothetical protein
LLRLAARDAAVAAVPDRSGLAEQIAGIEAHNRLVVENQQRAALEQQANERREAAELLTTTINRLDFEKAERLAAAEFPIDGLGLDDHGVTWQGCRSRRRRPPSGRASRSPSASR